MGVPLYDLTVGSYLQTLGAVSGFLDRGLAHCQDNNIDPESIVETRLWDDMLPFRFQIVSVAHHSLGAMEAAKSGAFAPPGDQRPHTYADLQKLVADTRAALQQLTPAEVNALEGGQIVFRMRSMEMPFTTENFLMSRSRCQELLFPRVHRLRASCAPRACRLAKRGTSWARCG